MQLVVPERQLQQSCMRHGPYLGRARRSVEEGKLPDDGSRGNGRNRTDAAASAIGLAFKLIIAPMAIGLLYAGLFGARGEITQLTIFEAAMPPQIGAAIVAIENDLDPQLVALMAGIGIPMSFLSLFAWRQVLNIVA